MDKKIYIIGGPNGAGKTTFVEHFLPKYIKVTNFVNADEINKGISPLGSTSMDIKSGKIMLELIGDYKNRKLSFGFETTLAGKKWLELINELKSDGYTIYLFFLDLPSVDLAISRVKLRVKLGGHSIPEDTIRRRYSRARNNFLNIYKNKSDYWYLFNNSSETPKLIAAQDKRITQIFDQKYFDEFSNLTKGED